MQAQTLSQPQFAGTALVHALGPIGDRAAVDRLCQSAL